MAKLKEQEMIKAIRKYKYYLLTMIISITILYIRMMVSQEMRIASDDLGCVALPAMLSGKPWGELIPTLLYKGFGYYIIFTPLFMVSENPIFIWFVIVLVNNSLIVFANVLAFYVCTRYLGFSYSFFTVAVVQAGVLCVWKNVTFNNEYPLYLLIWVITLLYCKINCERDNKLLYVLLGLTCAYALTLHIRAIVFGISIVFLQLLKLLISKSRLRAIIISMVVIFFVAIIWKGVIPNVQGYLWRSAAGETNSELLMNNGATNLRSFSGILCIIDMIVGNVMTFVVKTYGLGILLFASFIQELYLMLKKEDVVSEVFLMSFFCVALGILGVAYNWGQPCAALYLTGKVDYSFKGFSYFRYYGTFAGPAMLISINRAIQSKKRLRVAVLMSVPLVYYWTVYVYDRIRGSKYAALTLNTFTKDVFTNDVIFYSFFIIVFALLYFNKKNLKKVVFAIIVFLHIWTVYDDINSFCYSPELNGKGDAIYALTCRAKSMGIEMPDIYCTTNQKLRVVQWHLMNTQIHQGYPANDTDALIITSSDKDENLLGEYYVAMLDSNEYIWSKNKELLNRLYEIYYSQI